VIRRWLGLARRWVPTRERLEASRFVRPVAHQLADASLWRFTRRSVPRGLALGLFAGFILPVGQIVLAVLLAAPARGNVLVASAATLVTNPITFPAIYFAAYRTGRWLVGEAAPPAGVVPGWMPDAVITLAGATLPTLAGLLLFAASAAAIGYAAAQLGWRLWIGRRWRARSAASRR